MGEMAKEAQLASREGSLQLLQKQAAGRGLAPAGRSRAGKRPTPCPVAPASSGGSIEIEFAAGLQRDPHTAPAMMTMIAMAPRPKRRRDVRDDDFAGASLVNGVAFVGVPTSTDDAARNLREVSLGNCLSGVANRRSRARGDRTFSLSRRA